MVAYRGGAPRWGENFVIDAGTDEGFVRLAQATETHFKLESQVSYLGETGLESGSGPGLELSEESWRLLRNITPDDLDEGTDLASIPAPMRWWINTYGKHTPAALIHDRFVGEGGLPDALVADGVRPQHIDRYFRFMLGDSGIPFLQRWVMWSAVALHTRWGGTRAQRAGILAWALIALVGTVTTVWAVITGDWLVAALTGLAAPWLASALLWERQWGAGVVASFLFVPFIGIPVLAAAALLLPFLALVRWADRPIESIFRRLFPGRIEPAHYREDPVSTGGPRRGDPPPGISGRVAAD